MAFLRLHRCAGLTLYLIRFKTFAASMVLRTLLTRPAVTAARLPIRVWSTSNAPAYPALTSGLPCQNSKLAIISSGSLVSARESRFSLPSASDRVRCSASSSQPSSATPQTALDVTDRYDKATVRLVAASTISFGILLLPQILQNSMAMKAGDMAALSILSWVGFTTALFGNTVLLSYFVSRGEAGGARIQTLGAVSNAAVLSQVFLAGHMPSVAFYTLAAVEAVGMTITFAKVTKLLDKVAGGAKIWQGYIDSLGVLAVAVLVQAVYMTVTGGSASQPGAAAFGAALLFLGLEKMGKLPAALQGKWSLVPAWAATLLFGFQPVAQLVSNLKDPSSLAGIAIPSVVLATVANGLMVPRALFTADAVWFAGSAWGSLMGWAQLLSLSLGTSASGAPFLAHPAFAVVTAGFFSYAALFLRADCKAKGYSGILGSAWALLSGKTRHPHAEVP